MLSWRLLRPLIQGDSGIASGSVADGRFPRATVGTRSARVANGVGHSSDRLSTTEPSPWTTRTFAGPKSSHAVASSSTETVAISSQAPLPKFESGASGLRPQRRPQRFRPQDRGGFPADRIGRRCSSRLVLDSRSGSSRFVPEQSRAHVPMVETRRRLPPARGISSPISSCRTSRLAKIASQHSSPTSFERGAVGAARLLYCSRLITVRFAWLA